MEGGLWILLSAIEICAQVFSSLDFVTVWSLHGGSCDLVSVAVVVIVSAAFFADLGTEDATRNFIFVPANLPLNMQHDIHDFAPPHAREQTSYHTVQNAIDAAEEGTVACDIQLMAMLYLQSTLQLPSKACEIRSTARSPVQDLCRYERI